MKSIDADAALALKTYRDCMSAAQNKDLTARLLIGLLYDTAGYTSAEAIALFQAAEVLHRATYAPEDRL
jgi:hypothetical protein